MLRHGVDTAVVYASDTDRMKKEGLVIYEIPDEVMPEILFGIREMSHEELRRIRGVFAFRQSSGSFP